MVVIVPNAKVAKEHHSANRFRSTPVVMRVEQVYNAIRILKESHPKTDYNNPLVVRKLISDEFDCVCSVKHVVDAYDKMKYKEHEDTDASLIAKHCF